MMNTTPKVIDTIDLPDGSKYDILDCSQSPLQIPPKTEDWKVEAKIADLGMGKKERFCG
jgi:hypothetical protein